MSEAPDALAGGEAAPGQRLASVARRIAGLAEVSAERHERDRGKQAEAGSGDRRAVEAEGRALRDVIAGPL